MVRAMFGNLSVAWAMSTLLAFGMVQPARAADPRKAMEIAGQARLALEGKRYQEAADLMDEAFRLDPHPSWLANAGYARMMAGQQDRAVENLSAALQDKRLDGDDRNRAVERLGQASAARAFLARSDEAKAKGDFAAAARGYDSAFEVVRIGAYVLESASLWERAGDLDVAGERYKTAATMPDLIESQRRDTAESLTRVAKAKSDRDRAPAPIARVPSQPAEPPADTAHVGEPPKQPLESEVPAPQITGDTSAPVLGWVLVGLGGASIGVGIAGFVISGSEKSAAKEARSAGDDPRRAALDSSAETWWNVGLVTSSIGLACAVTGIILVATHDDSPATRSSLHVGGTPLPGGGLVTAIGRF